MPMNKDSLDTIDIMSRLGCGRSIAQRIIREIKNINGGGVLGKGKVLKTEYEYWLQRRGQAGAEPIDIRGDRRYEQPVRRADFGAV